VIINLFLLLLTLNALGKFGLVSFKVSFILLLKKLRPSLGFQLFILTPKFKIERNLHP
jgi:hypothetical protein